MSLAAMVLADRFERLMRWYDWWMRLITFGRDERVRNAVLRYVHPGESLLDLGCGTGSLAIGAARRGARVVGVDRSRRMLDLAREKARAERLEVDFRRGDATFFPADGEAFDVAAATFVLSELSRDEATFAVRSMAEAVRPGGKVLVADETVPSNPLLRVVSALIRLPLSLVAFAVLQELAPTRRHPWRLVLEEAGLTVAGEACFQAGTLTVLAAERPPALPSLDRQAKPLETALPSGARGVLLRLAAWWALPVPVRPGVYSLGSPDDGAPVLLTGNFLGSVEAVRRALAGRSCYLIVEDSSGWNVWCAGDAGIFTAERAAAEIRLYAVDRLVTHREVVIPGLAARVRSRLAEITGWSVVVGPLTAEDLPAFLDGRALSPSMRSLDRIYQPRDRLRVGALTAIQLPLWLLPLRLAPESIRRPVWRFSLAATWALALLHYVLPGRTGVVKGAALGAGAGVAMLAIGASRGIEALAVAASGPLIGWIYQATSPVVHWKRIVR